MAQQDSYYRNMVATERLALAGAAGVIAFLYTDLPSFAAGQARVLALLPAALIGLGALRSLSIYLVMQATAGYLREVEAALYGDRPFGFHNRFLRRNRPAMRMIEITTGGFWIVATIAALLFWAVYRPA